MDETLDAFLIGLKRYCLYMCRGYWQGTTCNNKRRYQQALADIRKVRREYAV